MFDRRTIKRTIQWGFFKKKEEEEKKTIYISQKKTPKDKFITLDV